MPFKCGHNFDIQLVKTSFEYSSVKLGSYPGIFVAGENNLYKYIGDGSIQI